MSTPKRRRSPKRSDVLKTPKNSAIDGEPHVNPNETAGIINQFEVLPEPDREFLSFEIRRTLEKAIRALSNFRLSEKARPWRGQASDYATSSSPKSAHFARLRIVLSELRTSVFLGQWIIGGGVLS